MALYLNLYHEVQKKKLSRQRDPFKLAIMAVLLVCIAFIGYYFWRSKAVAAVKSATADLEAKYAKLKPQQATAEAEREASEKNVSLATGIVHKIENRFYWAPLLEQLIQIVPPVIQITGMDGAVSSDGSAKKVNITLNGIATGALPRSVAEELRISLQTKLSANYQHVTSTFRSLEDGAEPIQYEGKPSPTAIFVIELVFTSPDINDAGKTLNPNAKTMKFGKEEIQKAFLGVLVLIGILYYYFVMLLGPLKTSETKYQARAAELGPLIDEANKAIKAAMPLKIKAQEAEATLDQVRSLIPEGSPESWFPPNIKEFFKRQGIEKCGVHPGDGGPDPALPGFKRLSWGLDFPRVEVIQLAIALSAFENEHPLMEIRTIQIEGAKDKVQFQGARMNLSTTVKQ